MRVKTVDEEAATASGIGSIDPHPAMPIPWGITRVVPFDPAAAVTVPYVELDPETQTGRYFDPSGQPIKAGKHGTNKQTVDNTKTSSRDGQNPQSPDTDSIIDYADD